MYQAPHKVVCQHGDWMATSLPHALYPLGPVATLRFCHLRPRCVSKQRRTTNVIILDRVWWIWCDAGLATVTTRPQRSPHSVASNSRPDYFAATRSRSLFLTINECCVSAAAAAIWEIQWRRSTPQLAPVDTGGQGFVWVCIASHTHFVTLPSRVAFSNSSTVNAAF